MLSGISVSIKPKLPININDNLDYNFITPYFISNHDSNTLYHAGNYVFKSTDRGDSWKLVSNNLINSSDKPSFSAGALAESKLENAPNGFKLEKYVLVLNPKNRKNIIEDKVLADSCEALIGAIYLDKGFNIVEKFILKQWEAKISDSIVTEIDAKTKLQEQTLKKFKSLPKYKLISNTGPRHKPVFKVGVKLPNTKYFIGIGNSKKNAEQSAATECLNSFNK